MASSKYVARSIAGARIRIRLRVRPGVHAKRRHDDRAAHRTEHDFQRDRLVLVNAGIIDGVRNVVVYANIGHSVFSDDGGHFYAGGGFKVVIGR
jgi:hypothetical protein